ncbi:MAG: SRPBCC family protein [Pseudomonadota bacterium]
MKFSTREDIDAPIDTVFEAITRFDSFERAATRRGVEVRRLSDAQTRDAGAAWSLSFMMQGKTRDVEVAITRCEAPSTLEASITSRNIAGEATCALHQLSPERTRMTVAVEVRPLTLSARVLLQPLKLAKTRLSSKFKARVAAFAAEVEAREAGKT